MWIPAYFSKDGLPETNLSLTLNIYDLSDNSVAASGALTEVNPVSGGGEGGLYKFNFSGHDPNKAYVGIITSTLTGDEKYAILDIPASPTVEGAYTIIHALRLILSYLIGKATGGGTSQGTFRDTGDSKNRVVMTVDTNGNRSTVTLDAS